jgi:hypothetical protein
MERNDNNSQGRESDAFGPTLCLSPEEDPDRKRPALQLSHDYISSSTQDFRPSEQRLVPEEKLGKSVFWMCEEFLTCLILIQLEPVSKIEADSAFGMLLMKVTALD